MVILLALADALSESTPVLITAGATITLVSIAFGMGVVWTRIAARLERIDGQDGALARARDAAGDAATAVAAELARLGRVLAALDRDGSEGDATLAGRIHRLGDITQDLQVRIAQAETHLGYDGRGQSTPVRPEPPPRPKRRTVEPGPGPGDSR